MKLIKKLIFCVAFISCSVYAQFFPYTDITIDVQDENRQFSVDREYYGTTPFYEFTITDNGSAVDLSGWDFALKYGYDKNADVLYTFTGSDYISVTNNKVLVNGTTNYWFEPHNDYYIALEGTYSSGNYKYIFAEGSMNVTYSPASDEEVNNILNGLTFTLFNGSDFVAYTNYINSTVRPEDLGTMAYVSTNDYATAVEGDLATTALQTNDVGSAAFAAVEDFAAASLTNNVSALEAGTNMWNSAVQPEDLGDAAHSNSTAFATAAQGALAGSAVQPEDSKLAGARSVGAYDSLSIGFNADAAIGGTSLGSKTDSGMSSVAVGMQAVASERYGVSVGYDSSALEEGIAIGKNAYATTNAIQLGEGNNTFPGTLQIYDSPFFNFVSGELYPNVFDTFANALGSAAWSNSTDFATAAEGDLAVTALQTNDVGSAAFAETSDFATDAELLATSNTLAAATSAVAESVVNLSHVVNPSLWGLSINGDLEPAGVSFGLLDDGLFEIDLTTGDIVLTGTQSTRFWQVSGDDIYPEVN